MTDKTILLFNAKSSAFPPGQRAALGPQDMFGTGRDIVWSASEGPSAGYVRWSGNASSHSFPHTETIVVVGGRLLLHSATGMLDLSPGDGAVIPRGSNISVEAEDGARWIYFATTAATSTSQGAIPIKSDVALQPSAPPPPQFLEDEPPQCSNFRAFIDESAGYRAGVWAATPHIRLSRPHPVHELMYIVAGHADVTDADGAQLQIGPGDAVFVARGTVNRLHLRDNLTKLFVIAETPVS
jgi:uncharacterized cupin superfamily protein